MISSLDLEFFLLVDFLLLFMNQLRLLPIYQSSRCRDLTSKPLLKNIEKKLDIENGQDD